MVELKTTNVVSSDTKDRNLFFENKIEPVWASTRVAAAILGISPNALRIRKCRGQIECRYFGNQLRFNVTYLQSLLRETRKE
jgi:hypothetical protein